VSSAPTDELQRVFKTLSDQTRVRILALLEQNALVVQELMEVLGMAQSRVSRHLAILREAGLVEDRRDGTYVSYRLAPPGEGPWSDAWTLVRKNLARDPAAQRDIAGLESALEARGERSRSFFDSVGPEWDALRKVFDDDVLRARAISRLVEPGMKVADIGTGTGILAIELARLGLDVVAIDRVAPDAANRKCECEFVRGDLNRLPLAGGRFEWVVSFQVIEHLVDPTAYVDALADLVADDGTALITTPNLLMSDGVNPYHVHEYTAEELDGVLAPYFSSVEVLGVGASVAVAQYLEGRRQRIERIMRLDPLGLRNWLPRRAIESLFALFAVVVRRGIQKGDGLPDVTERDFPIGEAAADCVDLLALCREPR